jgi:hypothetical protein
VEGPAVSVSEIEFCTLYVVAERWNLGCILRFVHAKNHFSDTLRFFPSIAEYAHQVQVAFCLADIAHDLLLQKLWRGPAPLLAKAAVK